MRRLAVVWRQERGVPVMVQLANELDDVLDHDLLAGPYPKR